MNLNNILLFISLILTILILLSILYGCRFNKNRIENFVNKNKENKNTSNITEKFEGLNEIETNFLKNISDGQYSPEYISKQIKEGKLTKTSIENMISYVEKNNNKLN